MFKCPKVGCNTTKYSDAWVRSFNHKGELTDKCTWCASLLVSIDEEKIQSHSINTRGCSGASNPFTH